jgi:hypothetical protein
VPYRGQATTAPLRVIYLMFSAPWTTLMLIIPLVSVERDSTRWNGALPLELVTGAAVRDANATLSRSVVGQPIFQSKGEPLSVLGMIVLSLPSIRARNTAMPVSRCLPSCNDEEKQAPHSNSPD